MRRRRIAELFFDLRMVTDRNLEEEKNCGAILRLAVDH